MPVFIIFLFFSFWLLWIKLLFTTHFFGANVLNSSGVKYPWVELLMEKAMAPYSSTLAWKIPGMGEPGGLLSLGLHRVGHDWSDLAAAAAAELLSLTYVVTKQLPLNFSSGCSFTFYTVVPKNYSSTSSPTLHCVHLFNLIHPNVCVYQYFTVVLIGTLLFFWRTEKVQQNV